MTPKQRKTVQLLLADKRPHDSKRAVDLQEARTGIIVGRSADNDWLFVKTEETLYKVSVKALKSTMFPGGLASLGLNSPVEIEVSLIPLDTTRAPLERDAFDERSS